MGTKIWEIMKKIDNISYSMADSSNSGA